jgi:hypothetical protein
LMLPWCRCLILFCQEGTLLIPRAQYCDRERALPL